MLYATAQDWRLWAGAEAPTPTGRQLQAASLDVAHATRRAVYAVDDQGAPTDTGVAAAFRDAALWQLDAIIAVDAATAGHGDLGPLASASLDGASYTLRPPGEVRAELIDPGTGLARQAGQVLAAAGLLGAGVVRAG